MAHTSEQRDKLRTPLCGAHKKNGELCRAFAGQGTDHRGIGRCKYHGGSTPNHDKAAITKQVKQRMVRLGQPLDNAQPHQVLLALLRATAGHVAQLHHEIDQLQDLGTTEADVLLRLYGEERDRAAKIAKLASEAGVAEIEIRIAETEIAILGEALMRACDAAGLSGATRQRLGAALREELARAEAQPRRLRPAV